MFSGKADNTLLTASVRLDANLTAGSRRTCLDHARGTACAPIVDTARRSGPAGPVVGDESSMPTKQRVGVTRKSTSGHDELHATWHSGTRDRRAQNADGHLALQNRNLVTQHEDLNLLGTVRATAEHHELEYEADKAR